MFFFTSETPLYMLTVYLTTVYFFSRYRSIMVLLKVCKPKPNMARGVRLYG